jgi:hypothetical protein
MCLLKYTVETYKGVGVRSNGGKRVPQEEFRVKSVPEPRCLPQIPHELFRDRTLSLHYDRPRNPCHGPLNRSIID